MSHTDRRGGRRGPYMSAETRKEEERRQADVLADPEVAAFARAYSQIKNPENRACVEWLVYQLAAKKNP